MGSDRLNRWLTLGANVGVVIGIILLIVELNQNREMMRAEIRNEVARGLVDVLAQASNNPELADIFVRANQGLEISESESVILGWFHESNFRYWENSHYQYRAGLYDEEEFEKYLITIENVITGNPTMIEFFCSSGEGFSSDFSESVEKILDKNSENCI